MKTFILAIAVVLTSCSCASTLSNRGKITSSTGFEVAEVAGWDRIPNVIPIPLPGPSYGDISLYHKDTDTLLFLSSIDKTDDAVTLLSALTSSKTVQKSNIVATPEIPGAVEVSVKLKGSEFRVIAVGGKKYMHLIQAMITKPTGHKAVSDFIKTFKQ